MRSFFSTSRILSATASYLTNSKGSSRFGLHLQRAEVSNKELEKYEVVSLMSHKLKLEDEEFYLITVGKNDDIEKFFLPRKQFPVIISKL